MARYVFNSAVITAFGQYTYCPIAGRAAKLWLQAGGWKSTIRYAETAAALTLLSGVDIPTSEEVTEMEPGDEALVFRLKFPKGCNRIPKDSKGRLDIDFVIDHHEVGLLTRVA